MKKIYLTAALIGASTLVFGQLQQKVLNTRNFEKAPISSFVHNKEAGEIIWSDDFSDASNWIATDQSSTSSGGDWVVGTAVPSGDYAISPIESTTAENGYAIFDSDLYCSGNQDAVLRNVNSIDLTGTDEVIIVFESYYRKFQGTPYVGYSTDGTNWTWVEVHTDLAVNDGSNNPALVSVATDEDFAGAAEAFIAFRYVGGCDYAWMVDDVQISTLSDNDITTLGRLFVGTEGMVTYYQIPVHQTQALTSTIMVENIGSETQTNVQLNAVETEFNGYSSSSTPITLIKGEKDSLILSETFTPTEVGIHNVEYSITADQEDDVPSNNQIAPYIFEITQDLYSRDRAGDDAYDSSLQFGYATGFDEDPMESDAIIIGNLYEIVDGSKAITAIEFRLGGIVEEGALVYGYILDEELLPVPGGDEIGPYITSANDEHKYVTIELSAPVTLAPGEYVIAVGSENEMFSVSSRGTSFPQTTFVYYEDESTWYYTTSTPIIRANFSQTVGISQEDKNIISSVHPNPFVNETTISYTMEEGAEVSYTIVDLAGNIVASANQGNVMPGKHNITIDGTGFANGLYFINLVAGDNSVTHKVIVNK